MMRATNDGAWIIEAIIQVEDLETCHLATMFSLQLHHAAPAEVTVVGENVVAFAAGNHVVSYCLAGHFPAFDFFPVVTHVLGVCHHRLTAFAVVFALST